MKLQTEIPIKEASNPIDYNSKLVLLGSCFAENIGEKFNYYKFQNAINPFGILFHPKAIENLVVKATSNIKYNDETVFFQNEQWHCYEAHSKLSHSNKSTLLNVLNENIGIANKQIHEASHIIITLGTAWVYRLIENGVIVANCHKVPQKAFNKELLSIETIVQSLKTIINTIKKVNPKAVIVLTVSPVRHIKDGFVENTQSKAHLISAIHEVINIQSLANSNTLEYFPSFEIMMDELRDYRFYKQDMLHPNDTAVNYIWERFKKNWINKEALKIMQDIEGIQRGLSHIPNNPYSESHLKFVKKLKEKQKFLKQKITHITF